MEQFLPHRCTSSGTTVKQASKKISSILFHSTPNEPGHFKVKKFSRKVRSPGLLESWTLQRVRLTDWRSEFRINPPQWRTLPTSSDAYPINGSWQYPRAWVSVKKAFRERRAGKAWGHGAAGIKWSGEWGECISFPSRLKTWGNIAQWKWIWCTQCVLAAQNTTGRTMTPPPLKV